MEAIQEKIRNRKIARKPETVAEFEQWEERQKSNWKYEFYYGEIIKKSGIEQSQILMVANLMDNFMPTEGRENNGCLSAKTDVFIDDYRKRVPDLSYSTDERIVTMARDKKEVPRFIIKFITRELLFTQIEIRSQDYLGAGVQLVWYMPPGFNKIHAHTIEKVIQIFVAGDKAIATPVLPDFKVEINKLFTIK